METVISVKSVCKSFKKVKVLDHVSLDITKGTICGLTGNNGSGKTVLMKIICGFAIPDSGSVLVRNRTVGKDFDFPPDLGVIIETPGFMQFMSGYKNLKNLADINKKIDGDRIKEVMRLVGLDPDDKKWVGKYSLGMRQRLGIAQAIMEHQDIMLLDEPMNGLDKAGISDVRKILMGLREEGKTILLTSHNAEDIEVLCDEVYEMENGVIKKIKENEIGIVERRIT